MSSGKYIPPHARNASGIEPSAPVITQDEQNVITNFITIVGDIRINSLEDFSETVFKNLKKLFSRYDTADKIKAYDTLKKFGYMKGNDSGKFNGFKHSYDYYIKLFNKMRIDSRGATIREFKKWIQDMQLVQYDICMSYDVTSPRTQQALVDYPCLELVHKTTWSNINIALGNLYNIIHIVHIKELWGSLTDETKEQLSHVQKYTKRLMMARDFENNIVYEGRVDEGHKHITMVDANIDYNLELYTQENLSKSIKELDNQIQEIKKYILNLDPLQSSTLSGEISPKYDAEYDETDSKDCAIMLLKKKIPKSQWHDCKEISKRVREKSSIYENKYLVESKNYEQLYMKYKAKYLELKNKLN